MHKTIVEPAYAKINYMIHVGTCREDGFHEVVTLMQTISLADRVEVSVSEGSGITLTVIGNADVPSDERNLAYRAAMLFMNRHAITAQVQIRITKNIPMAGGLAGGSADAAATLRALNTLFDSPMTVEELMLLAAELGSDIPFCIRGGMALCTGRGEIVSPFEPPMGTRHFLIVNRGENVNTKEAYARLDARTEIPAVMPTWEDCCRGLECSLSTLPQYMYNAFEPCILPQCPLAEEGKSDLLRFGAVVAMMSGSGSTVYGIFDAKEAAFSAQKRLQYPSYYATDVFPSYEV